MYENPDGSYTLFATAKYEVRLTSHIYYNIRGIPFKSALSIPILALHVVAIHDQQLVNMRPVVIMEIIR